MRPIAMLTDFGLRDSYVGQVKAAIASAAAGATVIDLTQEVEPYAIEHGAWLLETSLPVLPANAVVLAVVDPGVGTTRRGIAVQSGGRTFIGPDNGLLSVAYPEAMRRTITGGQAAVSPSIEVRELGNARLHRSTVAATFHARDIFGPVAAFLAGGGALEETGPTVGQVECLPPFEPDVDGRATIAHIDRYGNLITTIPGDMLNDGMAIRVGGTRIDRLVHTFGEAAPGELIMHGDSSGFVAIAQREGNAAEALGARRADHVWLVQR